MDGTYLIGQLQTVLRENSFSQFIPLRSQYDYLWKAAVEFVKRTRCMSANQAFTTVAGQSSYDQNPDFLQFGLMDTYNRYFLQYNDGTNTNNIYFRDFNMVVYANQTTSVPLPFNFTNNDKAGPATNITGTAGAGSGANLLDAAAPFASSGVQIVFPGDEVHDSTTGYYGLVTAYNSSSSIATAIFDSTGSTTETWTVGHGYVVVPQGRKQIILSPPPSASGCIVTVPSYVKKPNPVFTPYDSYPFDSQYALALAFYAAWLAKYQDEQPQLGDAFYKYWDAQVRAGIKDQQKGFNRFGYRVNMIKRSYDDRSYR
jgi:hypothetical protein